MGLRALFIGMTTGAILILMVWYYEMQIHFGFKVAVGATMLLYLVIPFLFHFSVDVQRHLVFLPYVRWPIGVNFDDPSSLGLRGTRNYYLKSEPDITIGLWHMLPRSLVNGSERKPESFWKESLRTSGKPIVIYLHGNSGSRAGEHRMELYVLLQDMDYHVITFDYRGYADSTQVPPNETGVVTDAKFVYKWVKDLVGQNNKVPVFIWGHSLGTGVSSHVVADLCLEGNPPKALVLESPFTSIGEEVKHHLLSTIYRYIPGFDAIFARPLTRNDMAFKSDVHIANISVPIAILHAVDDPVVPYFLGVKLFKTGKQKRPETFKPIYFKRFGAGFAHKYICRSPELPTLLENFLRCASKDQWPCPGFDSFED